MSANKAPDAPSFESAFERVAALAATYSEHRQVYLQQGYSEARVRQDFVDKFLTAFGWDVAHDYQRNPFEQEVRVEKNVQTGHTQRRADYAFFIAPNFRDVRFYVEAKKPSTSLSTSDHYFQTIRYGWNSATPIAFLTSFEEIHVLDCRYKPDIETSLERCPLKFHYTEFHDREKFAKLYYLLAHTAVAAGALEKYAASLPKKRAGAVQRGLFKGGYQSIDVAFLEELDGHRDALARSLKNRNPKLNGDQLTEITQRILDRLVFLRFLEDKLIETSESVASFGNKGGVWADFKAASKRLDEKYNGIVYKTHSLIDSTQLQVDDAVFGNICEDLSESNSPYNFDLIPIHILGSIYERFLGKVITKPISALR
jgi:adenine-specific DNA-methyltransferase